MGGVKAATLAMVEGGHSQHTLDVFDITFNVRREILSRLDVPCIHSDSERVEQSAHPFTCRF